MTKEEFLKATINLQEFYNRKLNETQLGFWFDELKDCEVEKYKRAIGEFAKNNKSLPALSEVLTKIRNLKDRKVIDPSIIAEKIQCSTCNGTGVVKYYKKENGYNYEYACKCYCENGKNCDLPILEYKDIFYQRSVNPVDFDVSQINF